MAEPQNENQHSAHALEIPAIQGKAVFTHSESSTPSAAVAYPFITQTVVTTWMFMIVLFAIVAWVRLDMARGSFGKVRMFFQELIKVMKTGFESFLGDKEFARANFPFAGTLFVFIVLGNFFGLGMEMIASIWRPLEHWFRPIAADVNTTLAMASCTLIISHIHGARAQGALKHLFSYLFHFSGKSLAGRIGNVLMGWIHLVGEFARLVSLSFRLFGNIFAGTVLIAVMTWLSTQYLSVPLFATIPFFLFEVFVAFFQGFIFTLLTLLYFKESHSSSH